MRRRSTVPRQSGPQRRHRRHDRFGRPASVPTCRRNVAKLPPTTNPSATFGRTTVQIVSVAPLLEPMEERIMRLALAAVVLVALSLVAATARAADGRWR